MEYRGNYPSNEEAYRKKLTKLERIGLWALAGISAAAAVACFRQNRKMLRLVGKATSAIGEMTVVDVQQGLVEKAVNAAANREVGRTVAKAVNALSDELTSETQRRVREAVKQNAAKAQKAVTDAIAREAGKIDTAAIIEEATEKAKEALREKFDGKLDGLMGDYQRNLDNVGKIYQSIASSMADKAGKDVTLKLG